MVNCFVDSILSTLKKAFCMKGRASRKEFWCYVLAMHLVLIVLGIVGLGLGAVSEALGSFWLGMTFLIYIALLIPGISVSVRRMHDVNLSGFWLWYMSAVGIGVVYIVYLLNLDKSVNNIVEKIKNVGSIWLGWILALILWPFCAGITLFLLFLYKGTSGDNDF
ncbi:MAG: DUF805 domain-containing protein, partial [Victivallales bacterium]|nr:DUF805 domain-containing protein [Victivallales bacterium]